MFFILSKIFYFFITPVSWLFFCMVWACFSLAKRKPVKRSLILLICIFLLFSNQAIFNFFSARYEIQALPADSIKGHYRYGVVLGGMASQNPITGKLHVSQSIDRVLLAIALYNQGKIDTILITGGTGNLLSQEKKEALELVTFCIEMGIPKENIIVEYQSRNTYENALFTKKLISPENEKILLITSAFHMRRSAACFAKQNYNFDIAAADPISKSILYADDYFLPKAEPLFNWATLIKEWLGLIAYKLNGYI